MHSARISTIGYLVFQISICHQSHAASLNLHSSTVLSHSNALEFSAPPHYQISSVDHEHLKPSSKAHGDIKRRNLEKKIKKNKKSSSCPSHKTKKYRVRAKLNQVLETVKAPSAPSGDTGTTSAQSTSGDAPSVDTPPAPAPSGPPPAPSGDAPSSPPPAPSGDAPSGYQAPAHTPSGGEKSGDATYYGTGLGACGIVSHDDSMIAAASHLLFDSFPGATANPNLNPICGRKVKATYEGKSVEVQIVDRCTGCAMHDLDFSPTAFSKLGHMDIGRLHNMKWEWM